MDVLLARTLDEALEMKAAHPEALPVAGGTDVMVELNFDLRRPQALIDICRLPELREWRREDGVFFLGAGVTYGRIMRELADLKPLAQASRTIGSPQIRNRGTVGGNLGTGSPAGDALPVLAAYDAEIVLASASRTRTLPWNEFHVGVKKTALEPDELILGARWRSVPGPGSFSKIGTRNAMVISIAGLCLVMDEYARAVRVGLGSVGPTVLRAFDAEVFVAEALSRSGTWDDPAAGLPMVAMEGFAERVQAAARPIDDVRGSASYRRHACSVMARRALGWALAARREGVEQT
jgi:CO/xanthine dehydrogenase FAD-binding subunit